MELESFEPFVNTLSVWRVEKQRAGNDSICSCTPELWNCVLPDSAVGIQCHVRMVIDKVPNRAEPFTSFRREIYALNANLCAHRNHRVNLRQVIAQDSNRSI